MRNVSSSKLLKLYSIVLHTSSTYIVVIECFVQSAILFVKLFHLIYAIAIQNAEDSSHFNLALH